MATGLHKAGPMCASGLGTVICMGETQGESIVEAAVPGPPVPGLVVVFSAQLPMYRLLPLVPGVNHVVGRDDLGGVTVPDERVSRQHAELCWSPGADGVLTVRDLNSRNGVFVDGKKVEGQARAKVGSVVRLAQTVLVVFDDLRRFYGGQIETHGGVVGPTLRQALDRAALAARSTAHLLGQGETGTGKERMAMAFHQAVGAKTPFVAVNCLAIPPALAASLFFGVVKGAATSVLQGDGYLVAADGGVLFLDEITELSLEIQGMLLRAVESGEVTPVGATAPRKINVRIVAASARDLRQAVTEGRFRNDLYYRLAQAELQMPALRERKEELPWLMQHALAGQPVSLHVTAVEAALLRPWPGNVRELLAATRSAATQALAEGPPEAVRLREKHLSPEAGTLVRAAPAPRRSPPAATQPGPAPAPKVPGPTREDLVEALRVSAGNVSGACRLLNIPLNNRTQIYRLMKEYGISREGAEEGS